MALSVNLVLEPNLIQIYEARLVLMVLLCAHESQ